MGHVILVLGMKVLKSDATYILVGHIPVQYIKDFLVLPYKVLINTYGIMKIKKFIES